MVKLPSMYKEIYCTHEDKIRGNNNSKELDTAINIYKCTTIYT